MATHHTYRPDQRPLAELLVDGTWHPGEVRMWSLNDNGTVTANASYSTGVGQNYIGTFTIDDVRPVDEHSGELVDRDTLWPWNRTPGTPKLTGSSEPA